MVWRHQHLGTQGRALRVEQLLLSARFINDVDVPKQAAAVMQPSAAKTTGRVGSTGPSLTIKATPTTPHRQPTNLRGVNVSSFIQAAVNVPNRMAVLLSSAL